MEIDKELIEGCVRDMKFALTFIDGLKVFGLSGFTQSMLLNLRIIELEETLSNNDP